MTRISPPTLVVITALVGAALTAGVAAQTTTTPTASFTTNESLALEAGPDQQLHGTTSLEAGTRVTVRIQSENASDPFLARPTATVDENGDFTVTQDMSDTSPGTVFTAEIRHDGTTLAETSGEIVECASECPETATATQTKPSTRTDEITVQSNTTVRRGQSAEITITTGDHDSVALTISDGTAGVEVDATLTDGDDDGRVTVRLDTTAIGMQEHSIRPVDEQDRLHINERGTDKGIPVGSYDVALAPKERAPVADTGTLDVRERASSATDELAFDETVMTAHEGRSTEIPVSVGDRDRATLVIGGQKVNYWLNATLVDGDGDGRVVAAIDAWAAGRDAPALTAVDADDRVSIDSETTFGDSIAPVEYDMRLYRNDDHDDTVDVGTLSVEEAAEPVTTTAAAIQWVSTARRGQSAEILLSVGNRDSVALTIGDETDGVEVDATVTDGDDDGRVTVHLDTTATDASEHILTSLDGKDRVRIRSVRGTDDGIPIGSYDVALAPNESAPAIDTETVTVRERAMFANDEPGFSESIMMVRKDGSIEMLVSVGDRDRAALTIGDDDVNYWLNATLVDGDGDGRFVAVFDAEAAGSEAPTLTAADADDRVMIDSETTLESAIEDTEYEMSLYRSDDYDNTTAVGTISVRDAVETTATETPETTATEAPETTASETPETTASETPETTASEAPETTATEAPETTASEAPETTESDTTTVATTEEPAATAADGPGFGVLGVLVAGALTLGAGLLGGTRD